MVETGRQKHDGMDIGYRRERSNDKIQNFWLEHRDRVAVYELGKMRGV